MDAKRVARAGVMVALLAVSAQVMVPLGPVPVTLQTLVLAMLATALDAPSALLAIGAYVLLGTLGMPVFSGFMGGIGALAGPTGGYLWGFILGIAAAGIVRRVLGRQANGYAGGLFAAVCMLLVAYVCGTVQLMALLSLDLAGALAVAVVPFVVPDAIKLAVGVRVGMTVRRAFRL